MNSSPIAVSRLLALTLLFAMVPASRAAELFPFTLPWDDATPGAVNLSAWLDKPAGAQGFVTVKDGHLFVGEKRLRIFGVNMCFGANFPKKEDAPKIAARMAKFGINCVRFHHMDMMNAPAGIFAKDGKTLDAGQLDRLDFFIAKLKEHGIYTDLNLHVSRTYPDRPREEKQANPSFDKGVDNFAAAMVALQKDFARSLLTHVNPYTGKAYLEEPAVALIEINNENALLDEWHGGRLDNIAAPYRAELGALWTAWLKQRHGDDAKLANAWAQGAREAGPELLVNGNFGKKLEGWFFEKHVGAEASAGVHEATESGPPVLQIDVKRPGKEPWHVQFSQPKLTLREGETYALTFRARADAKRTISTVASQAHEPWKVLASRPIELTPEWKRFTLLLTATASDDDARVGFSQLGGAVGQYEISEVSLRTVGIDGGVPRDAAGGVTPFTKETLAGRPEAAQRDWLRFLWETEERYWTGMYRFLREELKARPLIVGTQLGWSPFPIQAQMDVIDSHAYWHHPHFPRKQWDMADWTVKSTPMAGATDGGTLPRLAHQRVAGKPYICTEYNHAAPNPFTAETFPLVCAYAALQDWDGVFAFAYSHRGDRWDQGHFSSFFDIDQHPVKMATLPGALATFLRGDVRSAESFSFATMTAEDAFEQVRKSGPRIGAEAFGLKWKHALTQRVGVKLGERTAVNVPALSGAGARSDTGELSWDVGRAVTINAPRSKAVIGEFSTKTKSIDLGGVKITPGETQQNWAALQFTVLDGDNFESAKRILVTATGLAENTGLKWQNAEKTSVGKEWGKAPSLIEGVAATITFPGAQKWKAWALDERGQRRAAVSVRDGALAIGPEHQTLWYELAVE